VAVMQIMERAIAPLHQSRMPPPSAFALFTSPSWNAAQTRKTTLQNWAKTFSFIFPLSHLFHSFFLL